MRDVDRKHAHMSRNKFIAGEEVCRFHHASSHTSNFHHIVIKKDGDGDGVEAFI